MNTSILLYKLPHRPELYFNSSKAYIINNIREINSEEFLFAPFDLESKWPIYAFTHQATKMISKTKLLALKPAFTLGSEPLVATSQEDHMLKVASLIDILKKGEINKAVLSRVKYLKRDQLALEQVFLQLTEKYCNAFVYLCQLPNGQIWCGASPETLAKYEEGRFETMALAGTQSLKNKKLEEVKWEEKELDEQKWVQDHIEAVFNKKALPYSSSKTHTAQAGHLAHIRTQFTTHTNAATALDLLLDLHPTPAVCGSPTPASKKLIQTTENHDRIYYSGFLGVYTPLSFDLFVNLRCMRIDQEGFYLYVGGGITRDSDPKAEYLETENKAEVLKSVISEH